MTTIPTPSPIIITPPPFSGKILINPLSRKLVNFILFWVFFLQNTPFPYFLGKSSQDKHLRIPHTQNAYTAPYAFEGTWGHDYDHSYDSNAVEHDGVYDNVSGGRSVVGGDDDVDGDYYYIIIIIMTICELICELSKH